MEEVMSVETWLKLSNAGTFAIRGAELKRVDVALAAFHRLQSADNQLAALKALKAYMKMKGPAYKTGPRNKYNAIDDLLAQLSNKPTTRIRAGEKIAIKQLRDESRTIVNDLFLGKKLTYQPGKIEKLKQAYGAISVANTGRTLHRVTHAASPVVAGAHSGNPFGSGISFVQGLVPHEFVPDVMEFIRGLLPEFMAKLGAAMLPFAGVAVSGASTLYQAVVTIKSQYTLSDRRNLAAASLATDDPKAAIDAIVRMLERARNLNGAKLALGTGEFTAKLVGVLTDGGAVSNAITACAVAVVKFTELIYEILTDVKEARVANRKMAMPGGVDGDIFQDCPLLGAYLVCCAPTSVLVNTIFDRFGEHGWRGEVEYSVQNNINPLRETARALIRGHRYRITELQNFPGLMEVNKKKLKEMAAKKGKSEILGIVGFGSDDLARLDR
jgi:hypothetical protein